MTGKQWAVQFMLAAGWAGTQAAMPSGIYADPATGLHWSTTDNGRDIDWADAQKYCAGMADGWRLPRLDEISALYLASERTRESTPCGSASCHFPRVMRLSAPSLWSADRVTDDAVDGDELAWSVLLINGKHTKGLRDVAYGSRALCVRREQP